MHVTADESGTPHPPPEYPPGSIVRIKLRNFVTYSSAEFYPGPNLNIVIGPNGTGKSTVVCAIALGLAAKPDVLGRARDLHEFIKTGEERALIEIELQGNSSTTGSAKTPPVPGQNIIIKRVFSKQDHKSSWKLNGKEATEKAIKEAVASLNIQIDNLCQFLPQDRVSAFAQMDPPQLLKETVRAVGSTEMSDWHRQLITMGRESREAQNSIASAEEAKAALVKRNTSLEDQVCQFKEREKIMKAIDMCKRKIPWIRYDQARLKYLAVKEDKQRLKEELRRMQSTSDPLVKTESKLKAAAVEAEKTYKEVGESLDALKQQKLGKLVDAITKIEEEGEGLRTERSATIKKRKDIRKRVEISENEIRALERDNAKLEEGLRHDGLLGNDNAQPAAILALDKDIAEIDSKIHSLASQIDEVKLQLDEIREEGSSVLREREAASRELYSMDDIRKSKLRTIQTQERDVYAATMWLRDNLGMFKQHVFEPACLEINITDPRYADAVESGIRRGDMLMFVTQNRDDYNLFSRKVIDEQRLRVSVVVLDQHPLSKYQTRITKSELYRFGFDGFISDFITAPEPVLVMLYEMSKIYTTPVALQEIRDPSAVDQSPAFNNYISGRTSYSIRRAYGQVSVKTNDVRRATMLSKSVDPARKSALESELARIDDALSRIEAANKKYLLENESLSGKRAKIMSERETLVNRKRELGQQKQELFRRKGSLATKLRALDALKKQLDSIQDSTELTSRLAQNAEQFVALTRKMIPALTKSATLYEERVSATLNLCQIKASLAKVSYRLTARNAQIIELQTLYERCSDHLARTKEEARNLHDMAKDCISGLDQEAIDMIQLAVNEPLEQIEAELAENEARAGTMLEMDGNVINLYNTQKAEIDNISAELAVMAGKRDRIIAKVRELHEKWTGKLIVLIERVSKSFSEAFDTIGCTGEVQVAEDPEDYDKWGINILVKFRDHERLQSLTGTRQSGGERSVSTMLYLISLQDLSQSPFRVVDEINQGMDPRNERMVHRQIVKAACTPADGVASSQYFLITPKLLSDLEYHEHIRILCIWNGVWQPESLDVGEVLKERQSRIKRQRRARVKEGLEDE